MELDEKYRAKRETEESFCNREMDLANNNDDEMLRRIKLKEIRNDFDMRMARLNSEYMKELEEIEEKYQIKKGHPIYIKARYNGEVGKYERLLCGLTYYLKIDETNKLTVYDDVKFSKLLAEIVYIEEEWII